jgi:hypothetical protein
MRTLCFGFFVLLVACGDGSVHIKEAGADGTLPTDGSGGMDGSGNPEAGNDATTDGNGAGDGSGDRATDGAGDGGCVGTWTACLPNITVGWSGAGVTTNAPVTILPPN